MATGRREREVINDKALKDEIYDMRKRMKEIARDLRRETGIFPNTDYARYGQFCLVRNAVQTLDEVLIALGGVEDEESDL